MSCRYKYHALLDTYLHTVNAPDAGGCSAVSPNKMARRGMKANPKLTSTHDQPPSDPCVLPKALLVVADAKEVSHPDS